ncbi:aromatic-ring hydroxylase C-terminal domain-containing protein [Amycolatopsis thermoflava]
MRSFVATAADGADGVNKGLAGMGGEVTIGLAIGYPVSSVSLDGSRADRAHYVVEFRGPGFAGSTFDLFRGPHWTILVFSDHGNSTASFAGLSGDVHVHRFGAGPDTVVLVRPDGYVAARVPLWEAAQVRDHVQRLAGRQAVAA